MAREIPDNDWGPILADLERRKEIAVSMGGEEKLAKRTAKGLLNARERINGLLDPGSFVELGALVGGLTEPGQKPTPADGTVAGIGRIDGRPVLVAVEDFSVLGGSIGTGAASKRYRLCQLAKQERIPLVMMIEGAGHRMTNGLKPHRPGPNDLQGLAELSGIVPTVCLVMGAAAGHSALTAPLMNFVVMLESASLFSAGPPLVEAAIGQKIDKYTLGGTQIHVHQSGVAHNAAQTEEDAFALTRKYLSYFPLNAWSQPPTKKDMDIGERSLDQILDIIPPDPRFPYSMHKVLDMFADSDTLFEVQPHYGKSMITALAFLGGRSVAIVANNPAINSGTIDSAAAEKTANFIEVAGAFHLPVIFLADNPGVMAGAQAEKDGILRAAARMFAAQHRLRGPKVSVTMRKAFGFGSSVMAMNPFDSQTINLAFPGVMMAAMPAKSGGGAAKLDDDEQAKVDASQTGGPYMPASTMTFDDVIDPRDLRNAIMQAFIMIEGREDQAREPVAHHGILP
ncbi:carboxyl transferase [Halieaceae bacterium]|jgi:methylmalonyl-CoA decarboxylase subunit alpha|nr:carboxyl transferase [Halieaceae bacterium]